LILAYKLQLRSHLLTVPLLQIPTIEFLLRNPLLYEVKILSSKLSNTLKRKKAQSREYGQPVAFSEPQPDRFWPPKLLNDAQKENLAFCNNAFQGIKIYQAR